MSAATYTVLVSGSQDFYHHEKILQQLKSIRGRHADQHIVLVHAAREGAGHIAETIAQDFGWEVRNCIESDQCASPAVCFQNMLEAKPDVMLAFPLKGCTTTWETVREAWRIGVPVQVYGQGS